MLIIEYIVSRAFQFPLSRQLIARKHKSHAKTSIWNDTLKKYLANYIPSNTYSKSETELSVVFYNGSSIIVGGLDDSERTEKILGNEYITVFLNEATQLSWNAVQIIMTRLAQKARDKENSLAVPKLIMDCNPRTPGHWLHAVGVRNMDPDNGKPLADRQKWRRVHWSAYDNISNLPKSYIETLEALPEVARDRMLNGIWRSHEGLVYNEFDESIHVIKPFEIPASWKRFRAIDFGYTNPFVCLWGALDEDGRLYIYREIYKRQTLVSEHAEIINKLSDGEKISCTVADHDASERAALEKSGIFTEKARKNIVQGIQTVKCRLLPQKDNRPRLFFFDNLKHTLSEIYNYSWAPQNEDQASKEEPFKKDDHAMDALRYMAMCVESFSQLNITSYARNDGRFG
jgi:PBSX family phage terminase large subunit